MSGYRFCRTDDIPLLVDAYNSCRGADSTEAALTVADFKRAAREIGLWASSCMLAFEGETPIAVLLGAKHEEANFVHRIVVRDDRQRKGHGRHLLESLKRKCAILGPARLLTEVQAELAGVRRFFERCGFAEESRYADLVADAVPPAPATAGALVSEVTVEELLDAGALDRSVSRSWERSLAAIRRRSREIRGLAIASDVRIEAYLLHRDRDIVSLGASRPELLGPLLAALGRRVGAPLRIPRVADSEAPFAALGALGFRRETEYIGYAADIREP
jgi:GNAT superfamily N-acetyltransferase